MAVKIWRERTGTYRTLYEGCVLATRERNGYHDSDFYALCWDETANRIVEYEYATTRFATYRNSARVDASPEVIAKAKAWRFLRALHLFADADVEQAKMPKIGKRVRVLRGKHAGKEGEIFWKQERRSQYGTWSYGYRYGITLDGIREDGERGRFVNVIWTQAKLEVLDWESHLIGADEVERCARHEAEQAYALPERVPAGFALVA